jgi:hypothetical protein
MPTVGMKKFSYTAKGKKAAKDYAKATGKAHSKTSVKLVHAKDVKKK